MRVLVGCEESQAVCKAFRAKGHEAYCCDLQPCSGGHPEWHLQMDVFKGIRQIKPELGIFFPPCTYLTVSGNRHFVYELYGVKAIDRRIKQLDAAKFFMKLYKSKIPKIAIENPIGFINGIMKPTQIIQPYYFGDNVPKSTCLWLQGLPPLQYNLENNLFGNKTAVEPEYITYNDKNSKTGTSRYSVFGRLGKGHGKERSKTFPGIAAAMAEQWG